MENAPNTNTRPETIELMHQHASVRAYKPDLVPAAVIETIVQAAQRASTSSNLQSWSVVAVTDAARKTELNTFCGNQAHIAAAPVFLVWCADCSLLDRACALRGHPHAHQHLENMLMAAVDASLAMQNAALAAESMGLGICYIGGVRNHADEVIRILKLPRLVVPISGMTLGWPAQPHSTRPRLPLRAVLHWQKHDASHIDADLSEYDHVMTQAGQFNGRQIPKASHPGEMQDYSWTEHSARRVSEPARVKLSAIYKAQGFEML